MRKAVDNLAKGGRQNSRQADGRFKAGWLRVWLTWRSVGLAASEEPDGASEESLIRRMAHRGLDGGLS
jgi:hypothetical protein